MTNINIIMKRLNDKNVLQISTYYNYEMESIDYLNKNKIQGYNYTSDRIMINQKKKQKVSEEIYEKIKIKYKNNN